MTEYARLVDLARREHELVTQGRVEELPGLYAERETLLAELPQPTQQTRPYLERALELARATEASARAGLARARADLNTLGAHRRVAASYAGVAPAVTLDAVA